MEDFSKLLRDKYIDNSTKDDELFIVLSKHIIHYSDVMLVEFDILASVKGTRVYCKSTNFFLKASNLNYESDIEILKTALHKKRIKV